MECALNKAFYVHSDYDINHIYVFGKAIDNSSDGGGVVKAHGWSQTVLQQVSMQGSGSPDTAHGQ